MHYKTFLLFLLLFVKQSFAQKNDVWVRYTDPKTNLYGYKDIRGNIKIHAKFGGVIPADSFYNIIAIHDSMMMGHYHWYYLLKNGKRVGLDSVPSFEMIPDCESEGKISFVDEKTDREGVFDKKGIVIIPAMYNYVGPFFNGVAVARMNAMRKLHFERRTWIGGKEVLINTKNEILIDSLDRSDIQDINWYSMRVNDFRVDTSIYVNFKGTHGDRYSFIDYKKEFKRWFENEFRDCIYQGSGSKLEGLCLPELYYTSDKYGDWVSKSSNIFLKKFPPSYFKRWFQKNLLKQISIDGSYYLDAESTHSRMLNKFNTTCGAYFKEKFPVFEVFIRCYKKRQLKADSQRLTKSDDNLTADEFDKKYEYDHTEAYIEFIRTETGYKLLDVSPKSQWP